MYILSFMYIQISGGLDSSSLENNIIPSLFRNAWLQMNNKTTIGPQSKCPVIFTLQFKPHVWKFTTFKTCHATLHILPGVFFTVVSQKDLSWWCLINLFFFQSYDLLSSPALYKPGPSLAQSVKISPKNMIKHVTFFLLYNAKMCDDDGCSGSKIYIFLSVQRRNNFREKNFSTIKIFGKSVPWMVIANHHSTVHLVQFNFL